MRTDDGCLVLGASGFIGTNLCRRLAADGRSVRAFGTLRAGSVEPPCQWYDGRLADEAALCRALTGMRTVVHLASSAIPRTSDPGVLQKQQANVAETERMIGCCARLGVRRIIFLSSGGVVYAPTASGVCGESSPTLASTPYAQTRLAIEGVLAGCGSSHGIEVVILRVANAYGPHQRTDGTQGVIGRFLFLALSGQPLTVWGDGSSIRDYIFVQDVVDAVLAALAVSIDSPCVCNIGSGVGTSLRELVGHVAQLVGAPVEVRYLPAPAELVPANVLDVSKAADVLRWRPTTGIGDGLRRTMIWLRATMERQR